MEVTFSYMNLPVEERLDAPKIWDIDSEGRMIFGHLLKKDYKTISMDWSNMYRMVQSGYRSICGSIAKDGNMNEDNFVSMEMILLDFDEGYRLDEMKSRFSKYTNLIHTSRNHLKDKPKKGISERFRVILPLEHTHTDKAALRLTMRYIVEELYKDFGIDGQCKDLTRIMFCGGLDCQYFYNEGIYYPMDDVMSMARKWDESNKAKAVAKYAKPVTTYQNSDRTKADWYRDHLNTPLMEEKLKYSDKVSSMGGRNNALHQTGVYLTNDVGLGDEEVKSALMYLNLNHSEPLPEREVEATVFRSLRLGGAA